jgi:hypothetical protein
MGTTWDALEAIENAKASASYRMTLNFAADMRQTGAVRTNKRCKRFVFVIPLLPLTMNGCRSGPNVMRRTTVQIPDEDIGVNVESFHVVRLTAANFP